MDQDAFRSLLATPARTAGQSQSPSSSNTHSRFGRPQPKREQPTKGSSTDLKPRKVNSGGDNSGRGQPKPKRNPDGSLYRDRAAERRAGRDGDFADAEKLLEDFQARSETAGVSKDVLQDQMKYLGGDEHHSILVKGLDIALLERKKAELAQRADQDLGDVEDELDAAFENPAPPREHSGSPAAFEGASPVAGSSRDAGKKRGGKTRDELLAELRAMRTGGAAAVPGGATEGNRSSGSPAESRFKPIGASSADKKGKGKEAAGASGAGGGWKAVGASGDAPAGEKKKRKKRKVAPPEAAEASGTTAAESKAPAPGPAAAPAPPAAAPIVPPAPDDIDDDMDIFGGVGDYKGLDTDEDSDAGAAPAPVPAAVAESANPLGTASGGKRKYFDDDDEEDAVQTSTAPGGLGDLAAKQAAADAAAAAGAGARSGLADPAGGEGDEQEGEEGAAERRPVRLEGFSGSGPSVKELLELDKAREAEEKRQARKLKAKEKAEARRANMTDADKANQDYQKMMSHLEKRDGAGKKSTP